MAFLGNDMSNQVALGIFASWVIEQIKRSNHPWLAFMSPTTDRLNTWISVLIAAAASLGITFSQSGSVWDGATFTITVPAIATLAKDFILQLGVQFGWYHKVLKPTAK